MDDVIQTTEEKDNKVIQKYLYFHNRMKRNKKKC